MESALDVAGLPGPDAAARQAAVERDGMLTKPPGALGRLEELVAHLSAWQARHPPRLDRVDVHVFTGRHGVAVQNVSAFPTSVTDQMVENFRRGGAAINQLASIMDASLFVHDPFPDRTTGDWTMTEAMDASAFQAAVMAGRRAVDGDADLIAVGEMGIGNTTTAAAICTALFGGAAIEWCGAGTGLSHEGVRHKAQVIEIALALHAKKLTNPADILQILGGFELAGMAGCILEARRRRIPVVLDGFVAGAAAAVLFQLSPGSIDHCIAGHVSAEHAHRALLARIGLTPVLDLDMRLGEASGAALALGIIRAALACHTGMATFGDAGVAGKL